MLENKDLTQEVTDSDERKRIKLNGEFWKPLVYLGIIAVILAVVSVVALLSGESDNTFGDICFALAGILLLYLAVVQIFWDASPVVDIFEAFMTKPFSGLGLIFELSIDGIIWFIVVKLSLAILGFILSVLIAILGILICMLVAPFSFPFALISMIRENQT